MEYICMPIRYVQNLATMKNEQKKRFVKIDQWIVYFSFLQTNISSIENTKNHTNRLNWKNELLS